MDYYSINTNCKLSNVQKILTCLIAETHFNKESFIRFQNCTTYHAIHPANTALGGSAIIIKNNVKHFEEKKYVPRDIQATIVTVKTSKQNLTVSTIYCPPIYCIYANEYKSTI
jgi:GTP-sensing pleiotropic transcriptional regulator CodY